MFIDIQAEPNTEMPDWNTATFAENVTVRLGISAGKTARYLGSNIFKYNLFYSFRNRSRLFTVCGEKFFSQMAVNQQDDEGCVQLDESLV